MSFKSKYVYILFFVIGFTSGVGVTFFVNPNQTFLIQTVKSIEPSSLTNKNNSLSQISKFDISQQLKKDSAAKSIPINITGNKTSDWMKTFQTLNLPRERELFLMNLIGSKMRTSPKEILEFLKALKPSPIRNAAVEQALKIYAEKFPEEAIKQAIQLLQGSDSHNALVEIAHIWGEKHPQDAITWLTMQPDSQQSLILLENVASAAAQTDPLQLRNLIDNNILTPKQNKLAAQALAGVWAQNSPLEAIEWAKEYAARNGGNTEALSIAYLNWATFDPKSAIESLKTEQPQVSSKLAPEMSGIWASQDPKAAATWVTNSAMTENYRNQAIASVAEAWTTNDPEGALLWASSLSQDSRTLALQAVALHWSLLSPQDFEQKVATLPTSLQNDIHNSLKNVAATTHKMQ